MRTTDATTFFLAECGYRGLARPTLTAYRWALDRLTREVPELPATAQQVLLVLAAPGLGQESRHDLRLRLGRFFRWCHRRYGYPNPLQDIDPVRRRKLLPRVLTEAEVYSLLWVAQSPRDRVMLLLLLDTGIRVGELANLRWEDVDRDHLRVHGKTGARQVPLSPSTYQALRGLVDGPHLWTGRKGRLTLSGIQQVFDRLFARAGVTGRKTGPHTLRHTFATLYLRSGGNLRALQEILGHSHVAMTMRYVTLAARDVALDHAHHSPLRSLTLDSTEGGYP